MEHCVDGLQLAATVYTARVAECNCDCSEHKFSELATSGGRCTRVFLCSIHCFLSECSVLSAKWQSRRIEQALCHDVNDISMDGF